MTNYHYLWTVISPCKDYCPAPSSILEEWILVRLLIIIKMHCHKNLNDYVHYHTDYILLT